MDKSLGMESLKDLYISKHIELTNLVGDFQYTRTFQLLSEKATSQCFWEGFKRKTTQHGSACFIFLFTFFLPVFL